jgi:hypothetical protein
MPGTLMRGILELARCQRMTAVRRMVRKLLMMYKKMLVMVD